MKRFLSKTIKINLVIFFGLISFSLGSFANGQNLSPAELNEPRNEIVVKYHGQKQLKKIVLPSAQAMQQALTDYQKLDQVEAAVINHYFYAQMIPDDPYFSSQYYLQQIGAPTAWDLTVGSPEVIIAILDTGVDIDHPDLEAVIWQNQDEVANDGLDNDNNGFIDDLSGWDFVDSVADPNPKFDANYSPVGIKHGTAVAGVAAAVGNNQQGVAGVTWMSKIMPLRVLDQQGIGNTQTISEAIYYAVDNGADIINLSFVGSASDEILDNALTYAYQHNVVIVVSAGNGDQNGQGIDLNQQPLYPICSDSQEREIVGVGALTELGIKSSFSNYGSNCLDLTAPGEGLVSTIVYQPDQGYNDYYQTGWQGTSLAAPLVAGAAALLKASEPNLSNQEIISRLENYSDNLDSLNPGYQGQMGQGRVNIYQSLTQSEQGMNQECSPYCQRDNIVTTPNNNGGPHLRIFNSAGEEIGLKKFFAFSADWRGGYSLTTGDINADSLAEIIIGAPENQQPWVEIYSQGGEKLSEFLAYSNNFLGGVKVAAGDLDQDGKAEIITGPGQGGGPQVRIFTASGQSKFTPGFFAYQPSFRGGVNVTTGDLNGDGQLEIITAPGIGGGPQVRIFNLDGQPVVSAGFFAYQPSFRGGVNITTGDLDNDGQAEIITGPETNGGPQVRIFTASGQSKFTPGFFAYQPSFRGGVNVATGDLNGDGQLEIITGAGYQGGPQVRIFNRSGQPVINAGFFAYPQTYRIGVRLATIH